MAGFKQLPTSDSNFKIFPHTNISSNNLVIINGYKYHTALIILLFIKGCVHL